MKGVAVGDFLLPTEILAKVFRGDGVEKFITSVATTDFVVADRAAIRTVYRLLEESGPRGVSSPRSSRLFVRMQAFLLSKFAPSARRRSTNVRS